MNVQELNVASGSRTSLLTRLLPFRKGQRGSSQQSSSQHTHGKLPSTAVQSCATALPGLDIPQSSTPDCQPAEKLSVSPLGSQFTPRLKDSTDLGFPRNILEKYTFGRTLGSGGNGKVVIAVCRETGKELACKSIPKHLAAETSDKKKAGHLKSIQREVEVLAKLKGSLNVVKLEDVYEDDCHVHIIMEHCKGGELWHRVGDRHYSERTVASFMRAVLRTLAQCHSHRILHRDIKPGNFMLLDDSDRAPLKAIDFGLATPYEPSELPRTDLGLEGTPWYMAPEVLSSRVLPESDIWSAGIMAYQLLSGFLPFDDHKRPNSPSLSAVWKSILTDKLSFKSSCWNDVSEEAKDFISTLLNKDPSKRPTAKQALQHPWLSGNSAERSTGRKLNTSVVQRIQRFAQGSVFKRSVLQSIAAELLSEHLDTDGEADVAVLETRGMAIPVRRQAQQMDQRMGLGSGSVDRGTLAAALQNLGYKLAPGEADRLLQQVDLDSDGRIDRAALAASQVDWRSLQEGHLDAWLEIAKRSFETLDVDCDGVIGMEELVAGLREKVPETELALAVQQALTEAKCTPQDNGIDFPAFLRMLRGASIDSLDQYDDRLSYASSSYASSTDRLNQLLDFSRGGSRDPSRHGPLFDISNHSKREGSSREGSRHGAKDGLKDAVKDHSHHTPLQDISNHSLPTSPGGSSHGGSAFGENSVGSPTLASNFRFDVTPPAKVDQSAMGGGAGHWGTEAARRASNLQESRGSRGGALYARPGLQETRMHGASLYKNAVLHTVRE